MRLIHKIKRSSLGSNTNAKYIIIYNVLVSVCDNCKINRKKDVEISIIGNEDNEWSSKKKH